MNEKTKEISLGESGSFSLVTSNKKYVLNLDNLPNIEGINVIINGKTLSFSKDNVEWIFTYFFDMGLSKEREVYRFIRYLINEYSVYDYLGIKIPQEKWDELIKDFESYDKY